MQGPQHAMKRTDYFRWRVRFGPFHDKVTTTSSVVSRNDAHSETTTPHGDSESATQGWTCQLALVGDVDPTVGAVDELVGMAVRPIVLPRSDLPWRDPAQALREPRARWTFRIRWTEPGVSTEPQAISVTLRAVASCSGGVLLRERAAAERDAVARSR